VKTDKMKMKKKKRRRRKRKRMLLRSASFSSAAARAELKNRHRRPPAAAQRSAPPRLQLNPLTLNEHLWGQVGRRDGVGRSWGWWKRPKARAGATTAMRR
jgi:hypothetical protein